MNQQEILIVSKGAKSYTEAEVINLFDKSESLDDIKKVVENAEDRLYTSWATVDAVDKEGQKVPIEEAITQQEILMKRDAPIQDTHTNKNIGKTLAYRVLEHPITKTIGILHLNKIYKDNVLDDKVWAETVSGERKGSSVGGFSTDKQMVSDGSGIFESLKGFNWLETSSVLSGCNPYATNQAVSLIAKQDKMVEEKQVATEVVKEESDMSTETPEVSIDDRVARLEEGLGAVVSKLDELISATAGTPEVEKEAETEEETPEDEKEEESETPEEEKSEDEEVTKSLNEIKSELLEVKKQLEANKVVEVVKTERPAEVNKAETKSFVFTDVMKGKVSLNEFTNK